MVGGHEISCCSKSKDYCLDLSMPQVVHLDKDSKDIVNLTYDGSRLKWINDFDSLKKFVEASGLRGKWTSPGGRSKRFKSIGVDLAITWYYRKQYTLSFHGKVGNLLREELLNFVSQETRLNRVHPSEVMSR